MRGAGEAGGGAAERRPGEGRAGRGGAAAAHDNYRRRCGSGGSRGLGRPRAGHHGSGSPRPAGRHLRPRLRSGDPASRPERGEAQGPPGNVVQASRFFRRALGPRELGLEGSRPDPERKIAPEPPGGVVFAPDSSHRPGAAGGRRELPLPACRGFFPWEPEDTAKRSSRRRALGLGRGRRPRVSLSSRVDPAAVLRSV